MSKFQVGDEVWCAAFGPGKVTEINYNYNDNDNGNYPVKVWFGEHDSYTLFTIYGKFIENDYAPSLYHKGVEIIEHEPDRSPKLKNGQPVLVRNMDAERWRIEIFRRKSSNIEHAFICTEGCYAYCIPYEGNERLLGTSIDPTNI